MTLNGVIALTAAFTKFLLLLNTENFVEKWPPKLPKTDNAKFRNFDAKFGCMVLYGKDY